MIWRHGWWTRAVRAKIGWPTWASWRLQFSTEKWQNNLDYFAEDVLGLSQSIFELSFAWRRMMRHHLVPGHPWGYRLELSHKLHSPIISLKQVVSLQGDRTHQLISKQSGSTMSNVLFLNFKSRDQSSDAQKETYTSERIPFDHLNIDHHSCNSINPT